MERLAIGVSDGEGVRLRQRLGGRKRQRWLRQQHNLTRLVGLGSNKLSMTDGGRGCGSPGDSPRRRRVNLQTTRPTAIRPNIPCRSREPRQRRTGAVATSTGRTWKPTPYEGGAIGGKIATGDTTWSLSSRERLPEGVKLPNEPNFIQAGVEI